MNVRVLVSCLSRLARVGVLALAIAPSTLAAQERNVDVQRFTPALDPSGFLAVPGTSTPGPLRATFGFFLDYAYAPVVLEPDDTVELAEIEHRLAGSVSAQLGLGSRAAVGVLVPGVLLQSGERVFEEPELPVAALGDPLLAARYRLLGDASEDPLLPKDGPGLGLELRARLPAGGDTAYAGEGTTRLAARLLFDMQLLGAGIGGMIGYEHRIRSRRALGQRIPGELQLGVGAKVPLPSLHPLSAVGELRAALDFQSRRTSAFEGSLGLRATLGAFTLSVAGGGAFVGALGAPDARVIVGLWYAPLTADSDHDGIDDDDDQCPMLAEDYDGFQDHDGCPDPDNDNDMIPDIDDLCPNEEALEGQDEDEDGCTDPPVN